MRFLFPILYDHSETPSGGESGGETAEAAASSPPEISGPWASDLKEYFGDDTGALAAADRYMRERVQPRMTHLEEDTKDARELWNDLTNDPATTIRDLVASAFGNDVAESYMSLFEHETDTPDSDEAAASALSDEERELLEWARNRRDAEVKDTAAQEYRDYKESLIAEHKDLLTDDDLGLLDPFIAAAGEDNAAVAASYQAFLDAFAERHGYVKPDSDSTPEPPPVVGKTGSAPTGVPQQAKSYEKWEDMDDFLNDFLAGSRASLTPPPIVG